MRRIFSKASERSRQRRQFPSGCDVAVAVDSGSGSVLPAQKQYKRHQPQQQKQRHQQQQRKRLRAERRETQPERAQAKSMERVGERQKKREGAPALALCTAYTPDTKSVKRCRICGPVCQGCQREQTFYCVLDQIVVYAARCATDQLRQDGILRALYSGYSVYFIY